MEVEVMKKLVEQLKFLLKWKHCKQYVFYSLSYQDLRSERVQVSKEISAE